MLRARPRRQHDSRAPSTVSVIIPCFNYARFLPTSVRSALSQTGVEVDVVIVDDASTDGAVDVARRLAAEHPAVRVLAHETNQGPATTFNDGLELASGEFLVRLDADDMLTPGALARATALARAYPSVGLVYGHPRHFDNEPPPPRTAVRSWTVWPGRQWLADRCRNGLNVITAPEVVMRSSVVERVGGQQPLVYSHDLEMWMRIAAFSDVGRVDGPGPGVAPGPSQQSDSPSHRPGHGFPRASRSVRRPLRRPCRRDFGGTGSAIDGPAGPGA